MKRDRGVTIIELTTVIAIIAVLSVALLGGIAVLLRTNPVVSNAIAENHDAQQLTNYLYGDVRSTAAVEVGDDQSLGYSRRTAAAGCPGNPGANVLQLTWATGTDVQRASYRLVSERGVTRLDRFQCAGASVGSLVAHGSVNIADALDPAPSDWNGSGPPAAAVVENGVAKIVLYQSGRELTMAAALQSFGVLPTVPSATTTTPVLPSTTTTTTTVAPTTATTTTLPATTPPTTQPPNLICALLASISAVLQVPTGPAEVLRDFGLDGVAGVLSAPAVVTATVSVGVSLSLVGLNLDLSLCAAVQLAYNTGTTEVVLPMRATGTCAKKQVLGLLCLELRVDLSVDLPVSPYETWTTGAHALALHTASGVVVGSASTLNVALNAATVPTTTTTTTLPPVTVPEPSGTVVNPVAPVRGFSVMTAGDATLQSSGVSGGVAVGGDFVFRNWFNVASSASSSLTLPGETAATGLLVGGDVDLASSSGGNVTVGKGFVHTGALSGTVQAYGSAVHLVRSGTAANDSWSPPRVIVSADQSDQGVHAVSKIDAFPFANTFTLLNFYAKRIGQLDPATCPEVVYPQFYEQSNSPRNWVLNLSANEVNVLNVTSSQLASINSVAGAQKPSADTPLIINVTDVGPVTIPATWWPQWQNGDAASIVWNVPNSTSVTVGNSTLYGTLFAPSAAVSMTNVEVRGDVVAGALTTNGGSIQLQHLAVSVPCLV